ncbi:hypothetical protein HYW84_01060 [Candidatus Peregrinibacteria bacterium]|nr:hypothetical protein [Candidatus Peregrinibacteria bacterium]
MLLGGVQIILFTAGRANAMESPSYRLIRDDRHARNTPMIGQNFRITFELPELPAPQEEEPLVFGYARPYSFFPPATPGSDVSAPVLVLPPLPVIAPSEVLPVGKPRAAINPYAPIGSRNAPVMINGVPQRRLIHQQAPQTTVTPIPAKATLFPSAKPDMYPAPRSFPSPALTIPRGQFSKASPSKPATARGSYLQKHPASIPAPAITPSIRQVPTKESDAPLLMKKVGDRMRKRQQAGGLQFAASLFMDGNHDLDPVRTGLLAISVFLSICLLHARWRLRLLSAPRPRRRFANTAFRRLCRSRSS